MTVFVGTSGWQYRDWRGAFYPEELQPRDWLPAYAGCFRTVEVNNTFYRLPPRETFASWAARTPDDFLFALKVSRYLTHIRRLRQPDEPVRLFLERAEPLGRKLGPLLVQLPPNFGVDVPRLRAVLATFPAPMRVAVEVRHQSWFTDEVREVLAEHGAALCLADRGSRLVTPAWRTATWAFVRFHEGRGHPHPCYGTSALDSRARLLAEHWDAHEDVYAFFNNDGRCCAVRDARMFSDACISAGLPVTRVPAAEAVRVAGT
jgi:uncharacterized protein YecE (DUF72 family)